MVVRNKINFKELFKRFFICLPLFFYASINTKSAFIARGFKCIFAILYMALLSILIPLPSQIYLKNHNYESFKEKNVQNICVIYNEDNLDKLRELDLNFRLGIMFSEVEYGPENIGNIELEWTDQEGNKYITTVVVDFSLADQSEELYYDYTKEFDTLPTDGVTRTLICFFNSRMQIRINERSNYFEYPVIRDFSFKDAQSASEIGDYLVDIMTVDYLSRYSYSAMFSTLVFPLIFAFILFEVLKHKNVMFRYKHFVNITATSQTLPAIITLIISLIFPSFAFYYFYDILFVISFLIMIVLIHKNNDRIKNELE